MPRHPATVRGRISQTPLSARDRLRYVRDLLDLIRPAELPAERCHQKYLAWYLGVFEDRVPRRWARHWKRQLRDSAEFDWPGLHQRVRKTIVQVLDGAEAASSRVGITIPRVLVTWEAPDGKTYFRYTAEAVAPDNQAMFEAQVIESMLSDLSGLNVECIGQCAECRGYFARERPTRSQYCSARCRNLGYLKAHGFRRSKRGKREVA